MSDACLRASAVVLQRDRLVLLSRLLAAAARAIKQAREQANESARQVGALLGLSTT